MQLCSLIAPKSLQECRYVKRKWTFKSSNWRGKVGKKILPSIRRFSSNGQAVLWVKPLTMEMLFGAWHSLWHLQSVALVSTQPFPSFLTLSSFLERKAHFSPSRLDWHSEFYVCISVAKSVFSFIVSVSMSNATYPQNNLIMNPPEMSAFCTRQMQLTTLILCFLT